VGDRDLRALERRFRETGTVSDEAAWLRGRLRAGELTRQQLELAGWLSHPAAVAWIPGATIEDQLASHGTDHVTRTPLWTTLRQFGDVVLARVNLGLARAELPGFKEAYPDTEEADWLVAELEQFVVCPCQRHLAQVHLRERRLPNSAVPPPAAQLGSRFPALRHATYGVCGLLLAPAAEEFPYHAKYVVTFSQVPLGSALERRGKRAVQTVLQELIPWALGYRDQVAERALATERARAQDGALLRELQERYQRTQRADDEAAWIRERVRVGELARARVVQAAQLGHAPAALAVGLDGRLDANAFHTLRSALRRGRDWESAAQRALLPALRLLERVSPENPAVRSAAEAVERLFRPTGDVAWDLMHCENTLNRLFGTCISEDQVPYPCCDFLLATLAFAVRRGVSGPRVLAEIGGDLVPWLLGYADPLQERLRHAPPLEPLPRPPPLPPGASPFDRDGPFGDPFA
jgi:hypothetical protein